jgi:hypothetical protein
MSSLAGKAHRTGIPGRGFPDSEHQDQSSLRMRCPLVRITVTRSTTQYSVLSLLVGPLKLTSISTELLHSLSLINLKAPLGGGRIEFVAFLAESLTMPQRMPYIRASSYRVPESFKKDHQLDCTPLLYIHRFRLTNSHIRMTTCLSQQSNHLISCQRDNESCTWRTKGLRSDATCYSYASRSDSRTLNQHACT